MFDYDDEDLSKGIKQKIKDNSAQCNFLKNRIRETFLKREHSPKKRNLWHQACEEFHANKEKLYFPDGESQLHSSNPEKWDFYVVEKVLCFLEVRPYHDRSGYIRKYLLRHIKKAYLTDKQKVRLEVVYQREKAWKNKRMLKVINPKS